MSFLFARKDEVIDPNALARDGSNTVSPSATIDWNGGQIINVNSIEIDGTDNWMEMVERGSAPSTPAANRWKIYAKSDGIYQVDDAGAETSLAGGGGDSFAGGANQIQFNNSGDTGPDASSTFVFDKANNRLGVGIATPLEELDVRATVDAPLTFRMENPFVGRTANMEWYGRRTNINGPFVGIFAYNNSSYMNAIEFQRETADNRSQIVFRVNPGLGVQGEVIINPDGRVGIGQLLPSARLEVETTATEGTAAILIDQNDTDQPVAAVEGQESANTTDTISTHATAGTVQGWLQVTINGTKRWIPFYDDPSA